MIQSDFGARGRIRIPNQVEMSLQFPALFIVLLYKALGKVWIIRILLSNILNKQCKGLKANSCDRENTFLLS
jgi:hypothetical protein